MAIAEHNKRVTSTMRPGDLDNLRSIVKVTGVKEGQAMRNALALERFVQENLAEGATLWIRDQAGKFTQIVIQR